MSQLSHTAETAWAPPTRGSAKTSRRNKSSKSTSAMRPSLMHMLSAFKTEILWVVVFSLIANLLTLTPTLYMLQVFDRVMQSQNEFTLMALTSMLVLFLFVMAFAEFIRSRLLVRSGMRFDELMNHRVFAASFDAPIAAVPKPAN